MGTWSPGGPSNGADTFTGDPSDESANGQGGDDTLNGAGGNDSLIGDAGDDQLDGGAGHDSLDGGPGDDILAGGTGNDQLDTGFSLLQGQQVDQADGGEGNDYITIGGGTYYGFMNGGGGNDVITLIMDYAGTIEGGGGYDIFEAYNSSDLRGAILANIDETQLGGRLYLYPEDVYDLGVIRVMDSFGDLEMASAGLASVQHVYIDAGEELRIYPFESGGSEIWMNAFNTIADGGVVHFYGGNFNDKFFGTEYDDIIEGSAGDDTLAGSYGNDTIETGTNSFTASEEDHVDGGFGNDWIYKSRSTLNGIINGADSDDVIELAVSGLFTGTLDGGDGTDTLYVPGTHDITGATLTRLENTVIVVQLDMSRAQAGNLGVVSMLDNAAAIQFTDAGVALMSAIDIAAGQVLTIYAAAGGNDLRLSSVVGGGYVAFGGSGVTDIFHGSASGDLVDGNAGNDVLGGYGGGDVLFGDTGDDMLWGGEGFDELDGGGGVDVISAAADPAGAFVHLGWGWARDGWGHEDRLYNFENVVGSGFGDVIITANGGNIVEAGAGNDWVEDIGTGNDALTGQGGNDIIFGGVGDDALLGEAGDDALLGGAGNDGLDGGAASDWIYAGAGVDLVYGGDGDDVLFGGDGGGPSDSGDTIQGGAGNDALMGEQGDDVLAGQGGIDWIYGGAGNDAIDGGDGDDVLIGGDGASGADGDDTITGGAGVDALIGQAGDDALTAGDGDDWAYGGLGNDAITGGLGNDVLAGEDGDDVIDGGEGNDFLFGAGGNDTLYGGAGNDWIEGSFGGSRIYGGLGADSLFGGDGAHFIYTNVNESTEAAADVIGIFWRGDGVDRIDVSAIDADGNAGNGVTDFNFVSAFTNAAGQAVITWDAPGNRSIARFDVNGDGAPDMTIVVLGVQLVAGDFIL